MGVLCISWILFGWVGLVVGWFVQLVYGVFLLGFVRFCCQSGILIVGCWNWGVVVIIE